MSISAMFARFSGRDHSASSSANRVQGLDGPRTADGLPDLQGIWTNATITPLERPAQFVSKPDGNGARPAFEKQSNNGLYRDKANSIPRLTAIMPTTPCFSTAEPN